MATMPLSIFGASFGVFVAGYPFGVTAFAWTIAATGLYYLATWTPLARGSLALVALPIVNASLLVYPSFYKVDLCHEVRHLNTVMVEASTIGSRFVDHPDDLAVADRACTNQEERLLAASFVHLTETRSGLGEAHFLLVDREAVVGGVFDDDLAELLALLHRDDRLVLPNDAANDPLRIVCSMGLVTE